MKNIKDDRLKFWNDRALLGKNSGSNDFNLKKLEINELSKYMKDGLEVLELGCGNGLTSIEFAKKFDINITATDYSTNMIKKAKYYYLKEKKKLKGKVSFSILDLDNLNKFNKKYDLVFTERVLINLDSWAEQKKIINSIKNLLQKGGLYCMCENSYESLNQINILRKKFNLPKIIKPWHNNYFYDDKLLLLSKNSSNFKLQEINKFTSTYYLMSRIVNAAIAQKNNTDVSYNSDINLISLDLPPLGNYSQTQLWIWKKIKDE